VAVSRKYVVWAYRHFLGREPENEAVINDWARVPDVYHLVQGLLATSEFKNTVWQEFADDQTRTEARTEDRTESSPSCDRAGLSSCVAPSVAGELGFYPVDSQDTATGLRGIGCDQPISIRRLADASDVDVAPANLKDAEHRVQDAPAARGVPASVNDIAFLPRDVDDPTPLDWLNTALPAHDRPRRIAGEVVHSPSKKVSDLALVLCAQ
jgi:hypothetical protein